MVFKIFFLLSLIALSSSILPENENDKGYTTLQAKDFIEQLRQEKQSSSYYENVIEDLVYMVNFYYYKDIVKDPPSPKGFPDDYFLKVDLIKELKEVKTTDTNLYDFYRDIRKIFSKVRDVHFQAIFFGFENEIFNQHYLVQPVEFYTYEKDGQKKLYLKENELVKNLGIIDGFKNSAQVLEAINANLNSSVSLINGMNPFDYIFQFCSDFNHLKGYHGRYTAAKTYLSFITLHICPIDSSEVSLKVEYESGDSFETEFIVAYPNSEKEIQSNLEELNHIKNAYDFFIKQNLKKQKLERKINPEKYNKINWNYQYFFEEIPILQCFEDKTNSLNVYHQTSFLFDGSEKETELLKEFFLNCTLLFEENDFPIIVIEDTNTGGENLPIMLFQEYLQPRMISTRKYFSFGVNDYIKEGFGERYKTIYNVNTGKTFNSAEEFFNQNVTDNYDSFNFTRSQPVNIFTVGENRDMLDNIRNNFKKWRKPTEIIVFTDGFGFSATAEFLKGLQRNGGVITVGYNGHPEKYSEYFDSSLSPAGLEEYSNTELTKADLLLCGYFTTITARGEYADYYHENKEKLEVPLEFDVDLIDERSNIYNAFYESNYNDFVDEAKKIFRKYNEENKCNVKNLRLTLDSKECDGKFENSYTHGGFECGIDGKWNKEKCRPYYCDLGYYFDIYYNQCKKDPYSTKKGSSFKINYSFTLLFLFILML